MIRAGLQVPNFTFPGCAPEDLFETIATIATTAEQSGFDTLMVMDHFYQLPMMGPLDNEMFEAYTLLSAIAARTEKLKLGTLVTGVTYRNPAILAKTVTTLDVVSKGRAFLGIGAAWFDVEHHALGVEFPPVSERFERLEEAINICQAMFRGERPTIEGKHYQVRDAINSPAPVRAGGPPLLIGGQGERKTLRLVAQYADMVNLICGAEEIPHKIEVLERHCADVGRDPSEINKTTLTFMIPGATLADAEQARNDLLRRQGLDWDTLDEGTKSMLTGRMVIGGPDEIGTQLEALLKLGLDGIVVNLPANGHDPEMVALAGQLITAALPS
jgi:F420-dependent oxidoreductase-like protein